jgi:hypothetical protein
VRSAPLMGRGSGLSSFRRARQVSERERSTACVGYLPASQQEGFSAAEVVCWHIPRLAGTNSQQRWAPPALAAAAGIGAAAPRAPRRLQVPVHTLHCTAASNQTQALPAAATSLILAGRCSVYHCLTAAPCPACAAASLPAAGAGARFAPYSLGERLPDCGNCLRSCSGHLQQMRCPARFSQVAQQACCPTVHPCREARRDRSAPRLRRALCG